MAGADVALPNHERRTPAGVAAYRGQPELEAQLELDCPGGVPTGPALSLRIVKLAGFRLGTLFENPKLFGASPSKTHVF